MAINGVNYNLILTLCAEVGFDLGKSFSNSKKFSSWLCLCPNKKITGGKVLSSRSKKNKNRLAVAFRRAANAVGRQKDTPLSDFFRRIAFKKGRKVAITATARKLSVIVYLMLTGKQNYQPEGLDDYREKVRKQKINYIQKTIKQLGLSSTELNLK